MHFFSKPPITHTLLGFYLVIFFLIGSVRMVEYDRMRNINKELNELATSMGAKEQLLNSILKSTVYRRVGVMKMVYQSPPSEYAEMRKEIAHETEKIGEDLTRIRILLKDPNERRMFDSLLNFEENINHSRKLMEQLLTEEKIADAKVIDLNIINPIFANFQQIELRLGNYISQVTKDRTNQLKANLLQILRWSKFLGYALTTLLIIFGAILIFAGRIYIHKKNMLIESERKYRLFIEQTHELLIRIDVHGKIQFASKKLIRLLGLNEKTVNDSTIYDFVNENFGLSIKKAFEQTPREIGLEDIKTSLNGQDGKEILVQGSLVWEYQHGEFDGATGFFNEVTEKYKLKSQLRESENQFKSIFHNSPLPKFIADAGSYRFIIVNKAFLEKYGYTEEEVLTKTILDIRPSSERGRTIESLEKIHTAANLYRGRFQHKSKMGKIMTVEVYSTYITLNERPSISAAIVDVSEQIAMESRITQAIIKTQEDERYEIGGELHDNVCQILAAAKMNMSMMKNNLSPSLQPTFNIILDSIILANEEIRNLSHRLAPVFFEGSSLKGAFEQLLNSMKAVSNYDISFYYDESLEKIALNKELQLNLYRVAQEALRNIVKYAQATRIRLEAILYKENLNLLIADNGIGYDPEIPSKGIGIANMHRRVDFFQGHLMINSSPGDGCEILVKIPLKKLTRETVNPHTEKNSLHKSF